MLQESKNAQPRRRGLDLAYRYERCRPFIEHSGQSLIGTEYPIPQYARSYLPGQSDKSGHRETALSFDHVYTRFGVPAGADQQDGCLAQPTFSMAS